MASTTMEQKKWDSVIIYEDPITQRAIEGSARLVEKRAGLFDGQAELWQVEFDDGFLADRTIYLPATVTR